MNIKHPKPWLSAIVPSHNGERWLETALNSVVDQGNAGIEVILVDSSDTDTSMKIAARFSDRLPIRLYRRPDLLPWTVKTNFGAEAARGDWICILHQDDVWLPNRSTEITKWVDARSDAAMHLHPVYIIDPTGRRLGRWRCPLPSGDAPVPAKLLFERLLVQNFIAIPAPTIRRSAYLAAGGLDPQLWYTADWDLYLKLARLGEVSYHSDCLAGFRVHSQSLTVTGSRALADFRDQLETVANRHIGRVAVRQQTTRRLAATSIEVNVALAAANLGSPAALIRAGLRLLRLGPRGIARYVNYSRIFERSYPRLRARIAGGF